MPKLLHVAMGHEPGSLYDCEPCELLMLRRELGPPTPQGVGIMRDHWRMCSYGDPWGDGMEHAFATGEILAVAARMNHPWLRDAELHWLFEQSDFHPGPALPSWRELRRSDDWLRAEIAMFLDGGKITFADVVYWFRVACRYCDMIRNLHPELTY